MTVIEHVLSRLHATQTSREHADPLQVLTLASGEARRNSAYSRTLVNFRRGNEFPD